MDLPRFRDLALRTLRPQEVHVSLSGARVFHLHDGTGQPVAVFKSVPPDRPDLMAELRAEVERKVGQVGRLTEVVTHGDFCLPNVLVTPEGGWGFVDLGRAGSADPHRDLVAMAGSLRNPLNPQFGEADVERFLDAYGRERVDPELLSLHSEVDAFFWPVHRG